jgi:hypothetical protein
MPFEDPGSSPRCNARTFPEVNMQEESRTGSALLGLIAVSIVAVACATAATAPRELAAGSASAHAAASAAAFESLPRIDSPRAAPERARGPDFAGGDEHARRIAEQADIDARLARAHADAERVGRAVLEVEASLRDEIERLNGASVHAVR